MMLLFVETSPGPIKYAASLRGLCSNRVAAADGSGCGVDRENRTRGDGTDLGCLTVRKLSAALEDLQQNNGRQKQSREETG